MKYLLTAGALMTSLAFGPAIAAEASSWTLSGNDSKIAYTSIKKNAVGEVNHFETISGTVSAQGDVTINIDVRSVQTNIDIRNERMLKHVFDIAKPNAVLKTKIDMAALENLKAGSTTSLDVEGTLSLSGLSVDVETSMFVARLSDKRVMVTTDDMIIVSTEDIGVNTGVDKLMELAKLPSIVRVAPVTLRLVFDKDSDSAGATPAAATASAPATATASLSGDVKAGKKIFRRCGACHEVKTDKNKLGPHLVNIIGRESASVDGYKYSKVMKNAGIVWTPENLTAFLTKPKAFMKGTKMSFPGLKKEKDIQNILAYFDSLSR